MKKLILSVLILIGIVYYSHSQESLIPSFEIPKITILDENGEYYVKIPFERARTIDLWARRGIEAKYGEGSRLRAIYLEQLMEQIRVSKLHSDSVALALSVDLMKVRGEVSKLANENFAMQKSLAFCVNDKNRLEEENARLRNKIFWKDLSKFATYTGIGLGLLALIVN